jgi:hypothetical protein
LLAMRSISSALSGGVVEACLSAMERSFGEYVALDQR